MSDALSYFFIFSVSLNSFLFSLHRLHISIFLLVYSSAVFSVCSYSSTSCEDLVFIIRHFLYKHSSSLEPHVSTLQHYSNRLFFDFPFSVVALSIA